MYCTYGFQDECNSDGRIILSDKIPEDEGIDRIIIQFHGQIKSNISESETRISPLHLRDGKEVFDLYQAALPNGKMSSQFFDQQFRLNQQKCAHPKRDVSLTLHLIAALSHAKPDNFEPKSLHSLALENLSTIELHGPMSVTEFKTLDKGIQNAILITIEKQFSIADTQEFRGVFLNPAKNPSGQIFFGTCGGELVAFVGASDLDELSLIHNVDWFVVNPDSPVKGLSVAMGHCFMRKLCPELDAKCHNFYAACKPFVKSLPLTIEAGYVATGVSDPVEYNGVRFLRCRNMANEAWLYSSKKLNSDDLAMLYLKHQINTYSTIEQLSQATLNDGTEVQIAIVQFKDLKAQTNIDENHEQGWLYRTMQQMEEEHCVLTRYVPIDTGKSNLQQYMCIFEKSKLSDVEEQYYEQALARHKDQCLSAD